MTSFRAYAATAPGSPLQPYEYDPGPLKPEEVEVAVVSCGVCHSDLSMIDDDWGFTGYPLVAGHEAVGKIVAAGAQVKKVKVGDSVGVGWFSASCMHCKPCMTGHHNLCLTPEQTIVGRGGGFAERVRCHWMWATPLPAGVDPATAGPLFCGGITVFGPIVEQGVKPTDRVGVIGVGGLGHLAVQFLAAWGCDVTAFSSTPGKEDEIRALGAHRVVNSRDPADLARCKGQFDFILSTVNVPLDWDAYFAALVPGGRLHVVGAVLEPIAVPAFTLIGGAKQLSGSPLGSPATVADMLDFCARHNVAPVTEHFPMSRINDALEHLRAGKARYRLILTNDFNS